MSSIIIVPESCFRTVNSLPQELLGILDIGQWNYIVSQMNEIHNDANCTACAVEACVCCFCSFPLFCCHPCVSKQFEIYKRQEGVHLINLQLFGGRPVLSTSADGTNLVINTSFLNNAAGSVAIVPAFTQAQYTSAQYTTATIVNPSLMTYVPPAAENSRQFTVVVPENCPAGSNLTVLSPNGTQVQVTCPQNTKPGSTITVSY